MPLEAPVTTASPRSSAIGSLHSRFEHHLSRLVLLLVEEAIALARLLERQAMADEEGRVDAPLADHVEETREIFLHVRLPGADGQPLLHHGADGKVVDEAAVDARDRDPPALAAGMDG